MQSIDALSDALAEFEGGVVVISHDAQLLARVCDDDEKAEVWVVEGGKVEKFDGYFDDYRDELLKEIAAELEDDDAAAAGGGADAPPPGPGEEGYVNPLISNPALLGKG